MHFSTQAVVLGLLGLSRASALPPPITNTSTPANTTTAVNTTTLVNTSTPANTTTSANTSTSAVPGIINSTDSLFANNTEGFFWLREPPRERRSRLRSRALAKRGSLPPRDRTFADHMENHGEGLPECYKKCLRSEDGKSEIHMGKDTLGQICGVKWPLFAYWNEHHVFFCVTGKNGCQNQQSHRDAFNWLKSTCGDKPN